MSTLNKQVGQYIWKVGLTSCQVRTYVGVVVSTSSQLPKTANSAQLIEYLPDISPQKPVSNYNRWEWTGSKVDVRETTRKQRRRENPIVFLTVCCSSIASVPARLRATKQRHTDVPCFASRRKLAQHCVHIILKMYMHVRQVRRQPTIKTVYEAMFARVAVNWYHQQQHKAATRAGAVPLGSSCSSSAGGAAQPAKLLLQINCAQRVACCWKH